MKKGDKYELSRKTEDWYLAKASEREKLAQQAREDAGEMMSN